MVDVVVDVIVDVTVEVVIDVIFVTDGGLGVVDFGIVVVDNIDGDIVVAGIVKLIFVASVDFFVLFVSRFGIVIFKEPLSFATWVCGGLVCVKCITSTVVFSVYAVVR